MDNRYNPYKLIYLLKLKGNNYQLSVAVLSELPTNCQNIVQYVKLNETNYPIMRPVGSGWESAIRFIDDNFSPRCDSFWIT